MLRAPRAAAAACGRDSMALCRGPGAGPPASTVTAPLRVERPWLAPPSLPEWQHLAAPPSLFVSPLEGVGTSSGRNADGCEVVSARLVLPLLKLDPLFSSSWAVGGLSALRPQPLSDAGFAHSVGLPGPRCPRRAALTEQASGRGLCRSLLSGCRQEFDVSR